MTNDKDARLAYELTRGERCSDNHWYRTRQLLSRNNLEVNIKNAQFIAELRKVIPRSPVGVVGVLQCYQKAEELLDKISHSVKGADVLEMLRQYGISPHQSTISRWFQSIGGYRRNRLYTPEQLKNIFTSAFLYKAQFSTKLPQAN